MDRSLAARHRALRQRVADEKRALRDAKERVIQAARALDEFMDECRRRGISIITVPAAGTPHSEGAGAIHGRTATHP
jgi:hypothetical protein